MTKAEIIERMNRDHMAKILAFNKMPAKKQRRLPASFWSDHDCRRYQYDGCCQDCGQALIELAV